MIRHATAVRQTFALFVMTLLTVGCGATANSRDTVKSGPLRFTVLTYNIHHAEGTDQKLDLPRIAEVIRRCEPDFVALQEVDNGMKRTHGVDQSAELGRLLKMHATHGPAMDFQGGRYGNAILSRFEPKSTRLVPLAGSGGNHEPRSVIANTYAIDGCANGELVFASTHLDHNREPSDRLAQAKAIAHAFADEKRPMILAGDFNCWPGSPPLELLEKSFANTTKNDQTATSPPDQPISKIDHVLVRPPARWKTVEVRVIPEHVASDHRPVLVKLELFPP